jgi:AraC-like DNA-binding protein
MARKSMGPVLATAAAVQDDDILRLYFRDLCRLLDGLQAGGLADAALAHADLRRADLGGHTASVPTIEAYYRAVEWLHRAHVMPVAALQLGLQRRLADYGLYGTAASSVATFGEALRLGERFFSSAWPGARMVVLREGPWVVNRFELLPTAVCAPEVLLQLMSGASMAFTREMMPRADWPAVEVRYAFARPADAGDYVQRLDGRVRFGCGHSEFRFPVAWLDGPHRLEAGRASAQIEAQQLWHAHRAGGSTAERVLRVLRQPCGERFPALQEVAQQLGLSERSLRRHLAAEGTGFQSLFDGLRMDLAHRYVTQTSLAPADIAAVLGYAHLSSFLRAFQSRFGRSPTAMRVSPQRRGRNSDRP